MRDKIIAVLFTLCIFAAGVILAIREIPEIGTLTSDASISAVPEIIDADLPKKMPLRRTLVNVNGLFHKAALRSFVEDDEADVYRMTNGQLIYSVDEMDDDTLALYALRTSEFAESLGDIPLLYVQIPFKIKPDMGEDLMPIGTTEYANDNADELLEDLEAFEVDTMDLREEMSAVLNSSAFYDTDQHWKNGIALRAAAVIGDCLSSEYGISFAGESLDESKFETKVYEGWFLGAFGKKTGAWYAGVDDYDLVLPSYETDFEFTAVTASGNIERSGSFEDALLDKSNLEKDLFRKNTYETYTGGNYAYTRVVNNKNPEGCNLLLLRDSFSCSMMPFLSLGCCSVTAIDLREFDKSGLAAVIEAGDFDAVVIAYNPTVFGNKAFTFS